MLKTRLDTVVQVKELAEDRAVEVLGRAESAVATARQRVAEAKAAAAKDHRARADISQWEVTELAHHRAVTDAKKAENTLATLQKSAQVARQQYVKAHQSAEVVRRVADTRREELTQAMNRAEDKALDEAASLLFFRKAS
jgi:flagellar export protein FliJ